LVCVRRIGARAEYRTGLVAMKDNERCLLYYVLNRKEDIERYLR